MSIFSFFVYSSEERVNTRHLLWNRLLPNNRRGVVFKTEDVVPQSQKVTFGEYFEAACSLLKKNDFELLLSAVNLQSDHCFCCDEIDHISIFLEKHGAFYHPARVKVSLGDHFFMFVMNMAISEDGRSCIKREIEALNLINNNMPIGFLPKVYGNCISELFFGHQVSMFLGEWFVGFHEFHLTRNSETGEQQVVLWDSHEGNSVLSEQQTLEIYCQISMILCLYYDPVTSNQIFPWHNASGDFIANIDEGSVLVRLVTVRNIAPIFMDASSTNEVLSENEILSALTIFFLHTSLRIRLDRLDGVGNLVLADKICIDSIVEGFFRGLKVVAKINNFPCNFPTIFKKYMLNLGEEKLFILTSEIVKKIYKNQINEFSLISKNLDTHVEHFCTAIYKSKLGIDVTLG